MQANRENFGGQQGQLSTQVIRWVCHEGAAPTGQDQLHRGTQVQNCPGMAALWRAVDALLLHGQGGGWNGALAHGQDGGELLEEVEQGQQSLLVP